jgi:hypothetical protein
MDVSGHALPFHVTVTRYSITHVIIETPRYGGTGGGVDWGAAEEHDIIGHGWVEIQSNAITIAVHPKGVIGMLEPKEKRTYRLAEITSWRTNGDSVTFGVGKLGLFATNGAEVAVHNCQVKCDDADAARRLTEEARSAGLSCEYEPPMHSGI